MMRWSWVKRWGIVDNCWQNIIIKAVIIAIAYDSLTHSPSPICLIESKTWVEDWSKMYVFVLGWNLFLKFLLFMSCEGLVTIFQVIRHVLTSTCFRKFYCFYDNNWSVEHSVLKLIRHQFPVFFCLKFTGKKFSSFNRNVIKANTYLFRHEVKHFPETRHGSKNNWL